MPLDAPLASDTGGPPEPPPSPLPGTVESFRMLTARLRGLFRPAVIEKPTEEKPAEAVEDPPSPPPALSEPREPALSEPSPPEPEPQTTLVKEPEAVAEAEPQPEPEASPEPTPEAASLAEAVPEVDVRPASQEPNVASADVSPPEVVTALAIPVPAAEAAASSLLEIIWGALDLPPQERTLAGDTLLLLLPQLPDRQITLVAERVATMEQPPPLLLSRLLRDPRPGVSGLILERAANLPDLQLIEGVDHRNPDRLRLLAKRRSISIALAEHLAGSGDLLTMLALLRKAELKLSFKAFLLLSAAAADHPSLQAPLALRADLPLAVGLELFWVLPPELRRVILSRFLPDSATLSRLVTLALAASGEGMPLTREEAAASQENFESAMNALTTGRKAEAIPAFARLAGIADRTSLRILEDKEGEAMVALMKALSLSRTRFEEALARLRATPGLLNESRPADELTAVFDSLSYNKARVMLIYWDWFTRKRGPYAQSG